MALRALQGPTGGGTPVGGTGTTNTIPRWTGPSTLGDSGITDNGSTVSFVGRNITAPSTAGGASYVLAPTSGQVFGQTVASSVWYLGRTTAAGAAVQPDICVNNSGNVGIGTASPTSFGAGYTGLSINGTTTGVFEVMQGGSGALRMFSDAGTVQVQGLGARAMICSTGGIARLRISSAGAEAASQVAIGTGSFTTGRALTTVADLDVFGVTVGRGASGVSGNTAVGAAALASVTTGSVTVGVGFEALNALSTGAGNTAVGYRALWKVSTTNSNTAVGYLACANSVGAANTGIGQQALQGAVGSSGNNNTGAGYQTGLALTTGAGNTLLGSSAGDSITTGSSNIVIGYNADTAAAGDSNQFVLGDATNYVATNGGATTYYATAGASLGYMRVRLNGTYVKIEVFADV